MIHNGDENGIAHLKRTIEQLQDQLKEKRELIAAIVNCAPGIFYVTDETGRILKWNRQLEQLSGYDAAEIIAMNRSDFCAPEDRELMELRFKEALLYGSATAELKLLTKNGVRIPMLATGQRFEHNQSICIVGMAIDITSQRGDGLVAAKRALARQRVVSLTEREKKVVALVVGGNLNKVIASRMNVSTRSVEDWLREIRRKTGAENSAHLAAIAVLSEYPEFVAAVNSHG